MTQTAEINGKIIFNMNKQTVDETFSDKDKNLIFKDTGKIFDDFYPVQNIDDVVNKETANKFFQLYELFLMTIIVKKRKATFLGRLDASDYFESNVMDLIEFMTEEQNKLTKKIAVMPDPIGHDINTAIALSLLTEIAIDRFGSYSTVKNPAELFYPKPENFVKSDRDRIPVKESGIFTPPDLPDWDDSAFRKFKKDLGMDM